MGTMQLQYHHWSFSMSINLNTIKDEISNLQDIINNLVNFCNLDYNALFIKDRCLHKMNQPRDILDTTEKTLHKQLTNSAQFNQVNLKHHYIFNEEENIHRKPDIYTTYINTNFAHFVNNKDK